VNGWWVVGGGWCANRVVGAKWGWAAAAGGGRRTARKMRLACKCVRAARALLQSSRASVAKRGEETLLTCKSVGPCLLLLQTSREIGERGRGRRRAPARPATSPRRYNARLRPRKPARWPLCQGHAPPAAPARYTCAGPRQGARRRRRREGGRVSDTAANPPSLAQPCPARHPSPITRLAHHPSPTTHHPFTRLASPALLRSPPQRARSRRARSRRTRGRAGCCPTCSAAGGSPPLRVRH
jgi:hypothetical protein